MEVIRRPILTYGIENMFFQQGCEVGRGTIYLIRDSLKKIPYCLINDVFVTGERHAGIGTAMLESLLQDSSRLGYRAVALSRFENKAAHGLYEKVGLPKRGFEFGMDIVRPVE
jgi:hypothetical protein